MMARKAGESSQAGELVGSPAGNWHPIRTVVGGAFVLVPAHVFVVTSGLVLAAGVAGDRLPDGVLTTIGTGSLTFVLGVFGVIAGTVAGLAGSAKRLVDGFEDLLRQRVLAMVARDGARLFPAVATPDVRERYEAVLDRMVDEMLGRLRVPRSVRRLIRRGLEQSLVDEFVTDCERRGVATIGVTEVRNWVIATGLPRALAPIRGQIAVWRIVALGPPALIVTLLVLVSLIGSAAPPSLVAFGVCGVAGIAIVVAGHVGARTDHRLIRRRLGLAAVGITVAVAPWIWARLLPDGSATTWIGVVAVTLVVIVEGLRMALVSSDSAVIVSERTVQ
jgi:hypothetical protein